ncbi:hypothetical protein BU23DRAFT_589700 [Bimuria novae-zelandiae CBS 107.79]|uniref:Heterokaryon incompatibility domain-containing protein n=1 Tax=Bimuria novae-zelandiae CBS 107.79 TaxID=1447943 RepID=A0A6A5V6Z6_9PLEO|nr:hypothetical protein BU23DRAFT_589700 [Bimuria novae-zelandiae CBS 107.79]
MSDLISDARARFAYKPLDHTTDAIRLVKVLPVLSPEGHLQLELWHSVLLAKYLCVSYQWGEQAIQHEVLINGSVFTVGSNLYGFLQKIYTWAQAGFKEPLWVDAICINQSCLSGRGHQVQRMGAIYSEAQEVFVWLGDHRELAGAFYDWLHSAQTHQCPIHLRQQWDRIRFNPYWSRAWIKQEILLAKRVTVVLRGAKIEWTVLGNAIAKSGNLDGLDREHAAHLWSFWGERWRSKHYCQSKATVSSKNDLFSFWSLMYMHRSSECTDKRDRVYSLLGLLEEDHDFTVSYEETVADLFWRVGFYFDAWTPELMDILKAALLEDDDRGQHQAQRPVVDPWRLIQSVRWRPDMHLRIPICRVTPTNSFTRRIRRSVKCKFSNSEPFEIRLVTHHREQVVTTTLLSSATQVYDVGTDTWVGISTWSSLERALTTPNLDRVDRVKLSVSASYAIWIWFGVHPSQLDEAYTLHDTELSAHHALPSGTKITKNSVELPAT